MMLDVRQGFARPLIHLRLACASAGACGTCVRAGRAACARSGGGPCTCGPALVLLSTVTQQIANLHVTAYQRAHVFAIEIGTAELLQSLHQVLVLLIELRWQLDILTLR